VSKKLQTYFFVHRLFDYGSITSRNTMHCLYSSIQGIGILHEPPLHHFQFEYGIDTKNKNQTIKLKT
jgi:hypothetical protein